MRALIEKFDRELVDLAWSLWTELGVAGMISRRHSHCLIALEELIILTAIIAERDPRLRDEALDWCSRYHRFVSISRLRTLVKSYGESVYLPFSLFAETLNSVVKSKWPIFSHVTPLTFKPSRKSKQPDCQAPALLGLRLRALFGVGARGDLFTFLLTQNEIISASDVVEIGYSKRSLLDLLDTLVQSGCLESSMVRNQKKYKLVKYKELKSIVGHLPEVVPPWRRILEMFFLLRNSLQNAESNSASTNLVNMRNTFARIKNLLQILHLSPPSLQHDPDLYWASLTSWILETMKGYAHGNFQGSFQVNIEEITPLLMQHLYKVDDCVDGLESIINLAKEDLAKHSKVFREAYQLSLSYITELDKTLDEMLVFPFHTLGDEQLIDIPYQYSRHHLQTFRGFVREIPPLSQITNPRDALREYEHIELEINKVRTFINEFEERLKEIHYLHTKIYLLTKSDKLFKRHLVETLFS